MNYKRKFISVLMSLVMALSLSIPSFAATVPEAGDSLQGSLVILHVNDSHGRDVASEGSSIGTAGVAQMVKDYEAAGAEVLLMHAGDATQGTPLVNFEQGKKAYEFMNLAGYDAVTLGNHEFDWGTENLLEIASVAEFPILAANVINTETGETLFGDRVIFDTELGIKVGVFGLDTPETATKAHPDKVKGVNFLAGEEMYAVAQAQVDALKADGADLIVCIGHLGISDESIGNRSIDVINAVDGIDLFIDGHSHSEVNELIGDTLLVQTGSLLSNVGVVTYKDGELTGDLVSAADYSKVDEDIASVINAYNDELSAELEATVIGVSEVLLNGERDPGVRTEETNLGDFSADAILWYARYDLGEDAVDAAITNGGGIRESIQAGEVNMNHMITVFPFGNTVATVTVTGLELLTALEAATCTTPDAIGAFPQVAGMSFEIDTTVEYVNGEEYSTYYMPANPGSRIKNLKINGEPVDLEKTYVIATNDFTAAGGDTYGPFVDAPTFNSGLTLEDALIQYTQIELGGVISAEQYGEPAGRITVITADSAEVPEEIVEETPAVEETPVASGNWYDEAVAYVLEHGIMENKSEGDFAPNDAVTVAEIIDLGANDEELELMSDPVTRAQLAKLWALDLSYIEYEGTVADISGYADAADVAEDAVEAFGIVVGAGVISGRSDNTLAPNAVATRAELAQMFYNTIVLMGDEIITYSETEESVEGVAVGELTVTTVSKYGNLELDITSADLLKAGFAVGDIVTVSINGVDYEMPLCTNYSDVDNGALVLRASEDSVAVVAINMGDFASTYGILEGASVSIALNEAGGYLTEYELRNLVRTDNREDYASDEVYANFRNVVMGDIAEGVLYRSSSPINEEINRASYADKLAEAAGINTFINLADSEESYQEHIAAETFDSPYYKSVYDAGGVVVLNMGVDLNSEDFQSKLAAGLAFLAEHEGPYLIHCNEGKDRAGFTMAVLEMLMGGTVDEIVADYMVTYENFYGVELGSDKYNTISEGNIMESLRSICGLESGASLEGVDLAAAAEAYLTDIGLTAEQISAIKTNLTAADAVDAAA